MSCDLLFSGRFDAWLAAAPKPPLWLFVHVPKTAGSSLSADLAPQIGPYRSIHIDHSDRERTGPERFDIAVEGFLAGLAHERVGFVSGHILQRHVARIQAAVPGTALFTMLREPTARLVSDYLYQRSSMHPLAAEVRARVPDFDAFLELRGPRNRAARHLVPLPLVKAGDAERAIAHVRRNFAFVGVQERYALSFRALTAMFGQSRLPGERKRVNEEAQEERAAILARLEQPAMQARIRAENAVDFALWQHFAGAWDAVAAPLAAHLDGLGRTAAA
jgi:hypothetical protein